MSGAPLVLVPALVPDVAVLHVQRADEDGRAHVWGTLGVTRQAALAARRVIIAAKETRSRAQILSDPGLVLTPEIKVAAVVHKPFGAFPSPAQGYYRRRHDFLRSLPRGEPDRGGQSRLAGAGVYGVDD